MGRRGGCARSRQGGAACGSGAPCLRLVMARAALVDDGQRSIRQALGEGSRSRNATHIGRYNHQVLGRDARHHIFRKQVRRLSTQTGVRLMPAQFHRESAPAPQRSGRKPAAPCSPSRLWAQGLGLSRARLRATVGGQGTSLDVDDRKVEVTLQLAAVKV